MAHSDKTILDILLQQNEITDTQAADFAKDLNNDEIEKKLRREKIATSGDIAKAYAVLFDLPIIRLENYNLSSDAFSLIPKHLVEKYKIIAFEKEGGTSGGKIKIALAHPGNLKSNPPQILSELKEKKDVNVDLYITTPEDIEMALKRPVQPPPVAQVSHVPENIKNSNNANLKTVDLKILKIPYDVISKFPIEISQKYNMVVFDCPTPSLIKVAVSDPYSSKVEEILDFVRQKNEIAIEEFVASPDEIKDAIKNFYRKPEPAPEPIKPSEKEKPAPEVKKPELPKEEPKWPAASHAHEEPEQKGFFQKPIFSKEVPTVVVKPPVIHETEEKNLPKPQFMAKPEEQTQAEAPHTSDLEAEEHETIAPESDLDNFLGQEVKDVEVLKQIAETGNVPQILAGTVALGVLKKASDIHIEPEEKDLRIRFRIDGVLRDIIKMPLELAPALISRVKILTRLKIDEQRVPQDGRFDVKTHGHEIDLRVSTLPTVRGEKAALRILDKTQNIYTLEELGIAGRNLKVLEANITKPYGVILSTGPTGSGKSTTLYSIIKKISSPAVNIVTLEDPVEYEMPGINQCQVKPKIGFSFAEGLRSVLRQDPNIIMVGEIRDAETAGMATHAALTGHLVLSTLHTNDAAGALPRLTNMGIEPFLITSSVNVIVAQRLVRKVCSKCKKEVEVPTALKGEIEKELSKFNLQKPYHFYEGVGCSECNQGFSGRLGIYEVLAMSEKIEELAIKRRPASEIFTAAVEEGMVTMKQDGLIKATKGITTISEVLRVTTSG